MELFSITPCNAETTTLSDRSLPFPNLQPFSFLVWAWSDWVYLPGDLRNKFSKFHQKSLQSKTCRLFYCFNGR